MIKKVDSIVKRNIHGGCFLVDIKQNYLDEKCEIYELNEIGEFIWDQLDKTGYIVKIVDALMDALEEEVDKAVINKDVTNFIGTLKNGKFVEVCNGRD